MSASGVPNEHSEPEHFFSPPSVVSHTASPRLTTNHPGAVGARPAPDSSSGASGTYQPRVSSSSLGSSDCVEMPTIGSPRPAETRARISASRKCVVASTIAFARRSGSPDLKMPEPTKTPSAPSCMQSDASAGVAIPPAVNVTTGSFPFSATHLTSSYGARSSFASAYSSSSRSAPSLRMWPKTARMCVTALTMSPVPASPLVRIIAAPSAIRRSASPRFVQPQTKGTVNCHLSTWCSRSAGVSTSDSSM